MSRPRLLPALATLALLSACADVPTTPRSQRIEPTALSATADCDNLQVVLDVAAPGSTVTINEGSVCVGNFVLPDGGVTLEGAGSGATLDGGSAGPVLSGTLTGNTAIRNLTFQNGTTEGSGGAISLNARTTVSIDNSRFFGNSAVEHGGAVAIIPDNGLPTVLISGSTFGTATAPNTAGGSGGAVFIVGQFQLQQNEFVGNSARAGGGIAVSGSGQIHQNVVAGNTARSNGGGVEISVSGGDEDAEFAVIEFTANTVAGNTAGQGPCDDCQGGGIFATGSGMLIISGSTFSGNSAVYEGGAAFLQLDIDSIINTTVSGNTAGSIGGISVAGRAAFLNTTITGNRATDPGASGAGLETGSEDPNAITLKNSLLSDNLNLAGTLQNCSGTLPTSEGHNLEDGDTCGLNSVTGDGDLINTNPLLGPLADNGGPTRTHALLEDSPAIDMADDVDCPALDQRGTPRPRGDACDIGSFEAVAALSADIIVLPGSSRLPIRLSDRRHLVISVTILGSPTVNAAHIVPRSLTLGDGRGADASVSTLKGIPLVAKLDVDRDGDIDAVAAFDEQALISAGDLTATTEELVLRGALTDGQKIRGEHAVRVIR
jgi:hypothetical protein